MEQRREAMIVNHQWPWVGTWGVAPDAPGAKVMKYYTQRRGPS